jgi:hypothetical protein
VPKLVFERDGAIHIISDRDGRRGEGVTSDRRSTAALSARPEQLFFRLTATATADTMDTPTAAVLLAQGFLEGGRES